MVVLLVGLAAVVLGGGALLIAASDDDEPNEVGSATTSDGDDRPDSGSTGAGPGEAPEPRPESTAVPGEMEAPGAPVATTPEDTVDEFINFARAGDCVTLLDMTTRNFFAGDSTQERLAECESVVTQLQDITVTTERSGLATVSGSSATVTVTTLGRESTLSLVLEDGVWKVDAAQVT